MIGFIILIGLLSIEIILFSTSLKVKYFNYNLIRNARILTLALIIILIIFGVITWSFRYYGLIIVLLAMIMINHVKSLKNQEQLKPYTKKTNVKLMLTRVLLFSIMMTPSGVFPEYIPLATTGSYKVKTRAFVLEDENRIETFSSQNSFRQIGVHVWYPDHENETFPLIIYSHGGISLDTSNESLFLELASHGYVVFSISHPYHSIVTKNSHGKNIWINGEYVNELNRENARENPEESFTLYQKWMKLRTGDLNFIIDHTKLETLSDDSLNIFKQIDTKNIAVIGHSLGGSAALCIGRDRNDIKAIIALESPYMCDILGVDNGTFIIDDSPYPVPVLNVYSDSTWSDLSVFPQYKQNSIMLNDSESVVINIHIEKTGHFSLTDLSLTSPLMARLLNGFPSKRNSREVLHIINAVTLEFLDSNLKQ